MKPELGVWRPLQPARVGGGWTAVPAEQNHVSLVDLVDAPDEPWASYFKMLSLAPRPST